MLDGILAKSQYLREKIAALDEVQEVSGLGMMIGIALKQKKAADVLKECIANGLLVLTAKDRVRLLPPLTISEEEMKAGAEILCQVLK